MAKILRINMSSQTATSETIPDAYRGLGGRGLSSLIIDSEVPPNCDPLGAANKLVFTNGILGGTIVPCSGRLSVGAKSPLTKGIKESNTGGSMGKKMARLGIRAIIVEGRAQHLTVLKTDRDGVHFSPASELAGVGGYTLVEKMRQEHGDGASVACIGPAAETLLTSAAIIFTTPDFHLRLAARGGLGSVMSSKNLKAMVVEDNGPSQVEVGDAKRLKREVGILSKGVLANAFIGTLREIGTPAMLSMTNAIGVLPTRNFSQGQFENADSIAGDHMVEVLKARPHGEPTHRCMDGCTISCSNLYPDDAGKLVVAGLEDETLAMVGANCGIGDLDLVARINRACNDAGVDTMEIGGALAVAMEAGMMVGMPVMEGGAELQKCLVQCVSAVLGEDLADDYLVNLGNSVLRTEKRFNKRAGFTKVDDRLPQFFLEERNTPGGPVFDVPSEEIDRVNNF